MYDRVIGSTPYNRVIWGASPRGYAAFVAEALASGDGPVLEVGCGTAVFTHAAYGDAARELVLVDRSLAMLERARPRLQGTGATLLQADVLDLPFAPGQFGTVCCFAVLHVLDNPWAALSAIREQLAPDGRLFCSMLVTDRGGISRPYMAALRRRGELGEPRTEAELATAARQVFGSSVEVDRTGSMAWLRAKR
jgi:SAM-dependent methyltransferase